MENKNTYNAIVCTNDTSQGNNGYITYRKIDDLRRFNTFLDTKYPRWGFYTLYDKKTREKIRVVKNPARS